LGEEVVEEVDEEDSEIQQQQNSSSSATSRSTVDRAVDRRQEQAHGRLARSIVVHKRAQRGGGRPQEESGRLTEVTQLSVERPVDCPVDRSMGSVDGRSTDSRVCCFRIGLF